jgi:hypothetical protein
MRHQAGKFVAHYGQPYRKWSVQTPQRGQVPIISNAAHYAA